MKSDAGESAASINRRMDATAWERARMEMEKGFYLQRPLKLSKYYANDKGGISRAGVARLLRDGKIISVGDHTYDLGSKQ